MENQKTDEIEPTEQEKEKIRKEIEHNLVIIDAREDMVEDMLGKLYDITAPLEDERDELLDNIKEIEHIKLKTLNTKPFAEFLNLKKQLRKELLEEEPANTDETTVQIMDKLGIKY